MSEQFKSALVRALIVGGLGALVTLLATWATTDDATVIVVAVAAAFVAPFLARFGGEGAWDTKRAKDGDVQPADVGYDELHALRTGRVRISTKT
jgi:putative flippase GtrA